MRSIQSSYMFPLSSVKPLEGLLRYREYCLKETRNALQSSTRRRERSPINDMRLELFGRVDGFEYLCCPETGSLFLAEMSASKTWARLLSQVSQFRHSPRAFHSDIAQSRSETVYLPKLEWVQSTIRLQGLNHPRLMEVVTLPSEFTPILRNSGLFSEVVTVEEMDLVMDGSSVSRPALVRRTGMDGGDHSVQAAVLLESLDRVDDPTALLCAVAERLVDGGLIFVTSLVCSGFDMALLGVRNLYLYPPDRTNCFSLRGLEQLLRKSGFTLLEVSTPGVLDVEIVQAHLRYNPSLPLSPFERQLLADDAETHGAFQSFLQQRGMSSFARIVGKKTHE